MSSHHFVKEGQEPALFILEPISFQVASALLEWAPLVLVSASALDDVLRWGIKIDVVLAENSRVEALTQNLFEQVPIKILSYPPAETAMMKGLDFLIDRKQSGVNIITAISNDLFVQTEKVLDRLQISILDESWKWSAVSGRDFEKWLPKGTKLRVRKSFGSQSIQFQGLTGKSNFFESTADGIAVIRSNQLFWIAESHL